LQRELFEARRSGRGGDVVLLLEHEPVLTLGRNADASNVLVGEELMAARGVDLVRIDRGGEVTYHGPGQLVGYPILDLRPDRCDLRRYVGGLARTMIAMAAEHGVQSGWVPEPLGVWADGACPERWSGLRAARQPVKIGAIGVRLSGWVTMHGFALNLAVDLEAYRWIVPCGISEYAVASVGALTASAPVTAEVALGSAPVLSRALEWPIAAVEDLSREPDPEAAVLAEQHCGRQRRD